MRPLRIFVGNHSGLFYLPDACVVMQAILARRGVEQPAYTLGYDLLFAIPGYGSVLRRVGGLPAGNQEGDAALAQGALLMVFPGGDWESSRPWSQRNRIDLAGRKGFIRLALRHGVPVVPVVSHGAQHSIVVLSRGDRLARLMRLDPMHIHVFPVVLAPPFGVSAILTPPLPARLTVEFLPPLDWSHHGPAAARKPRIVDACYDEISDVMQHALDELVVDVPNPLLSGVSRLARTAASAPFRALRRS